MPFRLCNASSNVTRLIERVLVNVPLSRCVVYLDDVLSQVANFEGNMTILWSEVVEAICLILSSQHLCQKHLLIELLQELMKIKPLPRSFSKAEQNY